MRAIFSAVACLILLSACASKAVPDTAALGQQILNAEAAEAAGWAARDVDAIMKTYATDAIILLGGSPPMSHDDLRGLFVDFLKDPGFTLTFHSDPPLVAASGDIGITVGTYALTYTDPATQAIGRKTGRHLMSWKLQPDGSWQVIRQMTAHDRNTGA
jgi:ketosteroid isomerase-like protein